MTLLKFIHEHRGQSVQAPGGIGGQCVDLINVFLVEECKLQPRHLNAVDWAGIALPGMTWVANSPLNRPPADSIVVWGPYAAEEIGQYGHIAVAVYAEVMSLLTFDQNWPAGSPCSLVVHDYRGVVGWHRPAG